MDLKDRSIAPPTKPDEPPPPPPPPLGARAGVSLGALLAALLSLLTCHGCGPHQAVATAQRLAPDYGFALESSAGARLEVYPHALYYAGEGSACVAFAHRGRVVHTLSFAPGAAQFRLVLLDGDGGKVRLVAVSCALAHAEGRFTWIPCEDEPAALVSGPRVLFEHDPSAAPAPE